MQYSIFKPSYPVSIFVDHFMIANGYPSFINERLFPGNKVELCLNLGSINECQLNFSSRRFVFSETIISGLRSSYLEIFPGHHFFIAVIRFSLFGFNQLFRIPAQEIADENFEATDVLGNELKELRQKLGDLDNDMQMLDELNKWTFKKITGCKDTGHTWLKIENALKSGETLGEDAIDKLTGYSHKHTIKLFRQKAGLTPKTIQKIYRLNSCFNYMHQLKNNDWQSVLHRAGFYDQSHFIREFKYFTGFTPSEFLKQRPKDFELRQLR